ncbi:helix-turn-helix domain-containing protein [Streptococcus oralis subsp. tigurinus]|uniref:Helix-turn-helix domain-containing protein n=2 Tax=Streptococcus TaxID=1301 RepID=A0A1X1FIA6_STROR|nr:helix-turn-helix domain-containing protein [Streptococcus sp. CCUG 71758]ORO31974.1 helix-turn-helix domain-containing protein [Streptococcus oralis subsp. tigurinus]ORO34974.1 helix-turn-helix domain-containing protein [Streptococcus oralis subsp. tigurinus]ORO41424.1 helix-turn-helix domain-containing protein [Streptococcus oralis subsp. tigurinus]
MIRMRKKTIGEVLRLARINQGLSLEELQEKTEIQLHFLEAMEADDFDLLPSTFYARSFLRKYAWAVELDERIVLDAYDSGSMITYEEVDVDEEDLSGRRRSNKKKTSYLPLFYFVLFALSILIFVTYYVWNYIQTQPSPSSANYSVVNSTSSTTSSSSSSSSQTSSSSSTTESTITVSGEGNRIEALYKTSKETATVQLAVSDTTSWVSVSGSELEGGVTLSADNKNAKTTVSTKDSVTITLGVVKGVTVTVDNQTIDTSKLTTQTGTVTLTFTTD